MEVLGAIAGASQLAVYLAKLISSLGEVQDRLKNAPEKIKRYSNNIKALLETIRSIEQYRLVSSGLLAHLEATNKQASRLGDLLRKVSSDYTNPSWRKRYWKLVKGSQEQRILSALEDLEREKSGLVLCLASTNIELLLKHNNTSNTTMSDRNNLPPTPEPSEAGGDEQNFKAASDTPTSLRMGSNSEGETQTITNDGVHCTDGSQNAGVHDPQNRVKSFKISNKNSTSSGGHQNLGYSNGSFAYGQRP